ncbi:DUF2207 domain-containing protein [Rhodohalobacter sp. 614A]|uniref:DUF2207 domain-containing protein n=1 Tax=Rhodohalobacter sp. 614A TaxID=2908649 RepID=UPI001F3159D7|nr:DUF2207 domain-containing protein [Rhodohalobacter sp. 614A]
MILKKIVFLIFLLLLLFENGFPQDKSYEIPDIQVDVAIQQNGIVHIDEHRTYQFMGSFSWADYRLPKNGFSEIRNIQVFEGDSSFINTNNEQPGTFSVSEDGNDVVIKWFYQALDDNRTFTLSYDLADAVSVGPDWTEFFWNYIASGREKSTENLDINIQFPHAVSTDSLYVWLRTDAEKTKINKTPGVLTITAEDLTRHQSLQVRTAFPTSIFDMNSVTVTDPNLSLEWIQNDEAAYVQKKEQQAERQAYFDSITLEITILICALSIAVFILLYKKYGTRFPTRTISDRETILIPDSTPPAIIGKLMGNNITSGQHLVATIFDLARRGWFTIEEEKIEKDGFFSSESTEFRVRKVEPQPEDSLPTWEKMIVDHLNNQIENGYDKFDELFKEGEFKMSKWFPEWKKEVKAVYDEKNWIDKGSKKGVLLNIVAQAILIISSVALLILSENEFALIGMFVSALFMVGSFGIQRRTKEGQEMYKRWKAYRDGLKNADKRTIRMEMLDRHFIYAMALSLSQHHIETVVKSADDNDVVIFTWIILMQGSSHTPSSVAATVSTLASTSTSTFSSAGGGVGASAGAAGGGASGGAG